MIEEILQFNVKKGQKILQHCNHKRWKQMRKADIENEKVILEANN